MNILNKRTQYLGETPSYYPEDGEIDHLINRLEISGRKATRDEIQWLKKAQNYHQITVRDGNRSSGRSPSVFARWLGENEGITAKLKELPSDRSNILVVEVQHYSSSVQDRLANKTANFTIDDLEKIRKIEGPISFVERNSVKSMPIEAIREYAEKYPQRFSTLIREPGERTFYVAGDPDTAKQLDRKAEGEKAYQEKVKADEMRIFNEKAGIGSNSSLYWIVGAGILLTVLTLKQ